MMIENLLYISILGWTFTILLILYIVYLQDRLINIDKKYKDKARGIGEEYGEEYSQLFEQANTYHIFLMSLEDEDFYEEVMAGGKLFEIIHEPHGLHGLPNFLEIVESILDEVDFKN